MVSLEQVWAVAQRLAKIRPGLGAGCTRVEGRIVEVSLVLPLVREATVRLAGSGLIGEGHEHQEGCDWVRTKMVTIPAGKVGAEMAWLLGLDLSEGERTELGALEGAA